MTFAERTYWNTNSYGHAIRIRKHTAQAAFITLCIVTPLTNWMIPFARKLITHDIVYRWT